MKTTYKRARTIKEYKVIFKGWNITIPVGSIVSNQTACGCNDNYRFWINYKTVVEKITGLKCNMNNFLAHDLKYYGINIPAEYCEPYKKDN